MAVSLEQVMASLSPERREKVAARVIDLIAAERKRMQQQANQRQFHQAMLDQGGRVDHDRLKNTTEAEIEAYMIEEGENPADPFEGYSVRAVYDRDGWIIELRPDGTASFLDPPRNTRTARAASSAYE